MRHSLRASSVVPVSLAFITLLGVGVPASAPLLVPAAGQAAARPKAGAASQEAGWLTDAEGRQYKEARMPKTDARRVSADLVRTIFGVPIDVVREDDGFFYYKLYKAPALGETEGAPAEPAPAPQPAPARAAIPDARTLRLRAFDQGLPASGQWRDGFAIADMNGDSYPDIVTPPERKALGTPSIFLGDGKGNWRLWRETVFPRIGFDYGAVAAGDFNGDGHLDFALAIHLKGILALLGDGKGGFTAALDGLEFARSNAEMDKAYPSRSIVSVDWNGDGRLDLVAQGEGPALSRAPGSAQPAVAQRGYGIAVYLNAGEGRWTRAVNGGEPTRLFGSNLATGDFNGDGRPDVVMGSSVIGRQDLLAFGQEAGGWSWGVLSDLPRQSFVRGVASADFDRDGRDDVAVGWLSFDGGAWRNGVDVYLSRADGSWARLPLLSQAGREVVTGLAAGDVSGDGLPDLAGAATDGQVMLWRATAGGRFVRERAADTRSAGGCRASAVRIADLDKDSKGEIVAMFGQEASEGSVGCTTSGAMRAWKVVPAAPAVPRKPPVR